MVIELRRLSHLTKHKFALILTFIYIDHYAIRQIGQLYFDVKVY